MEQKIATKKKLVRVIIWAAVILQSFLDFQNRDRVLQQM